MMWQRNYYGGRFETLQKENLHYMMEKGHQSNLEYSVIKRARSEQILEARIAATRINSRINFMRGTIKFIKNPFIAGTLIAYAGSSVLNHITNTQLDMLRFNKDYLRNQREMQLGGYLEAGFMTEGAATDRQRLVQAMADSNFNGRSFIGNEAEFYRNTY